MFHTLYLVALFFSAAVAGFLGYYGWQNREKIGAIPFMGWMFCCVTWSLAIALAAIMPDRTTAFFFVRFSFIGIAFLPPFTILFVLEYGGYLRWLQPRYAIFYFLLPLLTQIILWTPLQPLMATQMYLEEIEGFFFLVKIDWAIWMWIHTFYSYGMILFSLLLLLWQAIKSPPPFRQQALILVAGAVLPLLFNMVVLSQERSVDWTPVGFMVVGIVWARVLFHYDFFDVMPVARDAVLESMEECVMVINPQNRILDVNPACKTLFAQPPAALIGQSIEQLFAPHPALYKTFQTLNEGEQEAEMISEGQKRIIHIRLSPLRQREYLVGRLIVLTDVTERALLIQDLNAYAHTVAHDLKIPLTTMTGYLNVVEMMAKEELSPQLQSYLARAQRSSYKMVRIIQELLLLAQVRQQKEVHSEPLDMGRVVEEAVERLEELLRSSNADLTQPDRWPSAMGYPPWIEEVWANYINNAIKYGGKPPHITVGATRLPHNMIQFWVKDNGQGITNEEQTKLFLQFSQLTPEKSDGHGLGLSIVQRIIDKSGGQVGVESEVDQGSTFWFTLPAAKERKNE